MNQPEPRDLPGLHVTQAVREPDGAPAPAVLAWIWLGVYALLAAGLLALLLALSRTPFIHDMVPGSQWFRVALVAHVDLSVLVWFIAGAGMLWSLHGGAAARTASRAAIAFAVIGTVMISIAPFVGAESSRRRPSPARGGGALAEPRSLGAGPASGSVRSVPRRASSTSGGSESRNRRAPWAGSSTDPWMERRRSTSWRWTR